MRFLQRNELLSTCPVSLVSSVLAWSPKMKSLRFGFFIDYRDGDKQKCDGGVLGPIAVLS